MSQNVCQIVLICLFIFILYNILCNFNKTLGGEVNTKVTDDTESELESESSDLDDSIYGPEPVLDDEGNAPKSDIDTTNVVPPQEKAVVAPSNTVEYSVTGYDDDDSYQFIKPEQNKGNQKLKPTELLPANSVDIQGNNFLTATLSKSEQIIGVPTQTQRSRKNYDLRSSPPNPQVEVSPWNMSTMEPDTERLQFEIGTEKCKCD